MCVLPVLQKGLARLSSDRRLALHQAPSSTLQSPLFFFSSPQAIRTVSSSSELLDLLTPPPSRTERPDVLGSSLDMQLQAALFRNSLLDGLRLRLVLCLFLLVLPFSNLEKGVAFLTKSVSSAKMPHQTLLHSRWTWL